MTLLNACASTETSQALTAPLDSHLIVTGKLIRHNERHNSAP